jgi:hypothetical protein
MFGSKTWSGSGFIKSLARILIKKIEMLKTGYRYALESKHVDFKTT